MPAFVRLDPTDNVVTATRALEAGAQVEDVVTSALIPTGHKIATRTVEAGEPLRKYAQIIGYALREIAAGDHVHTHNTEFRATSANYEFATDLRQIEAVSQDRRDTFQGYQRANGTVGTRNFIAIVTSVNCSATAARRIADSFGPDELAQYPNVDGVAAFVHGTGCGMAGDGDGCLLYTSPSPRD